MRQSSHRFDAPSRRRVLRALGTVGVAAVAGCLGGPDDDTGTDAPENETATADGTPEPSGEEPAFTRWTHRTPHETLGELTLAPTDPPTPALYVGSGDPRGGSSSQSHALYALTLQDGAERWRVSLPHQPRTAPLHGGDGDSSRLYLPVGPESTHGKNVELLAVDPVAGERAWTFDTEDRRFLYPLAATDDTVFVGRRDDQLGPGGEFVSALAAADGRERWRVESGDASRNGGRVSRGTLFLALAGRLRALDPKTGAEHWRKDLGVGFDGPVFDAQGKRLFVGHDGTVQALAYADGSQQWRREFDFTVSRVTAPRAAMSTTLYVGDHDGRLLALSPLEGETRWTVSVDPGERGFYPSVQRTSESLFLGGAGVHALDPVSGDRRWSFTPDVEGTLGVHASTTVFAVAPRANRLHALDPETGDQRWQFRPDEPVTGFAAAGDTAFLGVGGTVYALDGSASE